MHDSPLIPVGPFRQRRSFLGDDYEGDDRLAQWAEETGRLKPKEREGSTFYEIDDPAAPGGKRYVARRNSVGAPAGARTMTQDDGTPFVTQDKTYKPRMTNARAMSFKRDFDTEMADKKAEAERQRALAERIAEEQRAEEAAMRREDRAWGREKEKMSLLKTARETDPEMIALRDDRKRMRQEADVERTATTGLKSILDNPEADYAGKSRNAEAAMRQALAEGATATAAKAVGERAHQRDVDRLRQLEERGTPADLADAKRMRSSDRDLARVESFIRPRDTVADESTIVGEMGGFMSDLARKADEEDISPDFWNSGRITDAYSDLDQDMQAQIAANLDERILKLRSLGISPDAIKAALSKRMAQRGFPQDYIDAIMALVQ